jgi:hypothetical protein
MHQPMRDDQTRRKEARILKMRNINVKKNTGSEKKEVMGNTWAGYDEKPLLEPEKISRFMTTDNFNVFRVGMSEDGLRKQQSNLKKPAKLGGEDFQISILRNPERKDSGDNIGVPMAKKVKLAGC